MVLFAVDHRKAVGDRLEPGSLRRDANIGRDIRSVHNQSEPLERRVLQSELEQDRLKAAAAVDVTQLDSAHWRSCSRSCPWRSKWPSCSSRSPCLLTGSAIGSAGGAISRSLSGLSPYLFLLLPACRKTVRTGPCLPTSESCCSCSQVGPCSCSATPSSPSGRGRVRGWRWCSYWSRRWRLWPSFRLMQRNPTVRFKPSLSPRS